MKINHVDGAISRFLREQRRLQSRNCLTQEDRAIVAFLRRRGAAMIASTGHDWGCEATDVANHVLGIKCYHDDNAGKKAAGKLRRLQRLGLVAYEGWPGRKVWMAVKFEGKVVALAPTSASPAPPEKEGG